MTTSGFQAMQDASPPRQSRQKETIHLTAKTVECPALTLESIDNVKGRDSLALGMLSVGDSVADNPLQESL